MLGIGAFGGGAGAARFLARAGWQVTATDLRDRDQLGAGLDGLEDAGIALVLDGHAGAGLEDADLVIVNPALRDSAPPVEAARQGGAMITTEIGLLVEACPAPCAAVSGTRGKSTTTAMMAAMLEASGRRTWLGGNIGGSLLDQADEMGPEDAVVLEISSFMAERLEPSRPWPEVVVMTRVTSDHLDAHGTVEAYRDAKGRLLAGQDESGWLVTDAEDECDWGAQARGRVIRAGRGAEAEWTASGAVLRRGDAETLLFPVHAAATMPAGAHNRRNALMAAAGAWALGAPPTAIAEGLSNFSGLPHRFQDLGVMHETWVIDDAVSTTPEATLAALEALPSHRATLVCGGQSKGADTSALVERIALGAERVVAFGEAGPAFAAEVREAGGYVIAICGTLEKAVQTAWEDACPGGLLLFSPAFRSFDLFPNWQARADAFLLELGRLRGQQQAQSGR